MFDIEQDHIFRASSDTLAGARTIAERLKMAASAPTTITVIDGDGEMLAFLTNRRIIGTFHKQVWGGRKNDDAIPAGEEEFDATDAILLANYEDLMRLEDNDDSSDGIGRDHVSHSGPCSVSITDSVCEFFGVESLEDLTQKRFDFIRSQLQPEPPKEVILTVTVKVKLKVANGANVDEFIENAEYDFASRSPGILVTDTEILAAA